MMPELKECFISQEIVSSIKLVNETILVDTQRTMSLVKLITNACFVKPLLNECGPTAAIISSELCDILLLFGGGG